MKTVKGANLNQAALLKLKGPEKSKAPHQAQLGTPDGSCLFSLSPHNIPLVALLVVSRR